MLKRAQPALESGEWRLEPLLSVNNNLMLRNSAEKVHAIICDNLKLSEITQQQIGTNHKLAMFRLLKMSGTPDREVI